MSTKLFAVMLLSLALAACEPTTTDNNANSTNPAKASTPATAASPTPEASPSAKAELKAGDKVKVAANGSFVDATVVAVDDKAGKVTVRRQGDSKDTTVSLADVTKP